MDVEVVLAIVGSATAIVVALLTNALQRSADRKAEQRNKASAALADALSWIETAYRVRRRTDDQPPTLQALSAQMHSLQERLLFHEAWLRVEIPPAYPSYRRLVSAIKNQARPHLQGAWRAAPVSMPSDMNIGNLFPVEVEAEISAYAQAVRRSLSLWSRFTRGDSRQV